MSTDNLHDDAEFERFLAGEGELSAQLKGLPQAEPSADLDAAVFASIEAAMAAEKVQQVEAEPRPAANDPVGPAVSSSQRRRSLAYYWHWPVGVAAGILLMLAYRTAFEPYQPPAVALNDSMQSRVISPVPRVTAQPDVITEPGRVAAAPAIIEPPDVASQPAPAAAAPEPPIAAAASVRESMAPAGAVPPDEKKMQRVVVTGSQIKRADAETPSSVQVVTVEDVRISPVLKGSDTPEPASGVELAWTRDPAQDVVASRATSHAERPAQPAATAPSPTAAPAPMPAAEPVPEYARKAEPATSLSFSGGSAGAGLAASVPSSSNYGIIDKPSAGYNASEPGFAPDAPSLTGGANARIVPPTSLSLEPIDGNNNSALQLAGKINAETHGEAASHDSAHGDPREWLALIEREIKEKQDEAALAEWDKFIAAHPAYKVKNKLRAAIKALRDRQQSQLQPASTK
jgi:hypothetical protein